VSIYKSVVSSPMLMERVASNTMDQDSKSHFPVAFNGEQRLLTQQLDDERVSSKSARTCCS
jgi:hypothetical protein